MGLQGWQKEQRLDRTTPHPALSPRRGIKTCDLARHGRREGPIAQSEERRTRIAEVVGSNPIRSTMQVVNRFLAASAADHRT